jgi:osmotically-inducible protein OsmY
VERELPRFDLDFTFTTVSVINQVVYFGGRVRPIRARGLRGLGQDTRREMLKVVEAVRAIPGVKDVVLDCQFD